MNHRAYLLFVFVVCSAASFVEAQPKVDKTKPLIWGADADGGIPYVFADPDNPEKMIGFEVDLAEALAKQIGRPIEFQQRNYSSLLADVERGDIDFAMNGLEILPESLNTVSFTKPYYLYHQQLVVRADSKFESLDDIKKAGLIVGTLEGAAAERVLDEHKVSRRSFKDQDGPYSKLSESDKELAGVLLDLPAAIYYGAPDRTLKNRKTQPGLRFAGQPFAEGLYGIAVKKDNKELENELNGALDRLRDSGELKRILQKWELWTPDQYRLAVDQSVVAAKSGMTFSQYFPILLEGAAMTVFLTVASMILAVMIGLPVALLRLYGPAPLRWASIIYVEFFRGIPVLLLLYFLYYGLSSLTGLRLGAVTAAILGFALNYSAYEAEIYRAGISSIPKGQWEAAASLGMSSALTFRRVILPQAIRVILPPMTNDLVALFKDTSVVSIIAVVDLSNRYQILTKSGGGYLQIGLATAFLYLIMSVPLGYLSRYLEHRWGSK